MNIPLVIPTYKRTRSLESLLRSFAGGAGGAEAHPVAVFDDAPENEGGADTRALVDRLNSEYGLDLELRGYAEREAFVRSLADRMNGTDGMLRFALYGGAGWIHASGCNRNAVLLRFAGSKVVSADDNIRFRFHSFQDPEYITGLREGMGGAACFAFPDERWRHFKKRRLKEWTGNIFHEFEHVLGKNPRELGFYPEAGSDAAELSGPVRIAAAGICGERWYLSRFAPLSFEYGLRSLMWKNRREYAEAMERPRALLLAPELSLEAYPFFTGSLMGYDSSSILPPFLPHTQNEDGIWAYMIRCMYGNSPIGHLPFAAEYDTSPRSPFTEADSSDTSLDQIILWTVQDIRRNLEGKSPQDILVSLGEGLGKLASMPEAEWRDYLLDGCLVLCDLKIHQFGKNLKISREKPSFWAEDVWERIGNIEKSKSSLRPWAPAEFQDFGEKGEAEFRHYLARIGELLRAWPEIWEAACAPAGG
ncbi:MAG: hypothetical protein LBP76_00500 [Treponema sp.]|jgi:hypothetical protein|nr:hypothetical protein [Treponema sp.]